MDREYTVQEIDKLRAACERLWLFGTTKQSNQMCSRTYYQDEKDSGVENLVRTYMIAGKTAEDLYSI